MVRDITIQTKYTQIQKVEGKVFKKVQQLTLKVCVGSLVGGSLFEFALSPVIALLPTVTPVLVGQEKDEVNQWADTKGPH